MVRLYEHQGKRLLQQAGVSVPRGAAATTAGEARSIASELAGPVVVKAQTWATGRAKAGGILFAADAEEAETQARQLLGQQILGQRVERVLVEERLNISREFYAGIIVDDSHLVRAPVVLFSTAGGVDIEEVLGESPSRMARMAVDVRRGLRSYEALDLVQSRGLSGRLLIGLGQALHGLYHTFRQCDARSAEINPLVVTREGQVYAADCRISIDDASVMRHPELGISYPREADRPPTELERLAWQIEADDYRGVSFFAQLVPEIGEGGYIGYHAISGGAALLAADILTRQGLKLANFAETSGNPPASKVYRCAKIILSQPGIEGYCLIGAVIANQDQRHHARGLVKAFREELVHRARFPVVVLLAGNREEESLELLRAGLSDLPVDLHLYGREHIHRLDIVASRMKSLVDEYGLLRRGQG